MYVIVIGDQAKKFLDKLSGKNLVLVDNAIRSLASNPYQSGIKKLKARNGEFRLRAGNFRIIYTIDGNKLIVTVMTIGDRKDVYD